MTVHILIGQCLCHAVFAIVTSTSECSQGHGLLCIRGNLSTPWSIPVTKTRAFRGSAKEARKPGKKTKDLEGNKANILS